LHLFDCLNDDTTPLSSYLCKVGNIVPSSYGGAAHGMIDLCDCFHLQHAAGAVNESGVVLLLSVPNEIMRCSVQNIRRNKSSNNFHVVAHSLHVDAVFQALVSFAYVMLLV